MREKAIFGERDESLGFKFASYIKIYSFLGYKMPKKIQSTSRYQFNNPQFDQLVFEFFSLFEQYDIPQADNQIITKKIINQAKVLSNSPLINFDKPLRLELEEDFLRTVLLTIERKTPFGATYPFEIFEAFFHLFISRTQNMKEWQSQTIDLEILCYYYQWFLNHPLVSTKFKSDISKNNAQQIFSTFFDGAPIEKAINIYNTLNENKKITEEIEKTFFSIVKLLAHFRKIFHAEQSFPFMAQILDWNLRFDTIYGPEIVKIIQKKDDTLSIDDWVLFSICLALLPKPPLDPLIKCFRQLKKMAFFNHDFLPIDININHQIKMEFLRLNQQFIANQEKNKDTLKLLDTIQKRKKEDYSVQKNINKLIKTEQQLHENMRFVEQDNAIIHIQAQTLLHQYEKRQQLTAKTRTSCSNTNLCTLNDDIKWMKNSDCISYPQPLTDTKKIQNVIKAYQEKNPQFFRKTHKEQSLNDYFMSFFFGIASYPYARKNADNPMTFEKKMFDNILHSINLAAQLQYYIPSLDNIFVILTCVNNIIPFEHLMQWCTLTQDFGQEPILDDLIALLETASLQNYSLDEWFQLFQMFQNLFLNNEKKALDKDLRHKATIFRFFSTHISHTNILPQSHLTTYLNAILPFSDSQEKHLFIPSILLLGQSLAKVNPPYEPPVFRQYLEHIGHVAIASNKENERVRFCDAILNAWLEETHCTIETFEILMTLIRHTLPSKHESLLTQCVKLIERNSFDAYRIDPLFQTIYDKRNTFKHYQGTFTQHLADPNLGNDHQRMYTILIQFCQTALDDMQFLNERHNILISLLTQMDRIQQMFLDARHYHLRTQPFFQLLKTIDQVDLQPSGFIEKMDSVFEAFDELLTRKKIAIQTAEIESYNSLENIWRGIHKKDPTALELILLVLEQKIAKSNQLSLKIAKINCLLNMGCTILAHDLIHEILSTTQNRPPRMIKQIHLLNAITLERLGHYQEAVASRNILLQHESNPRKKTNHLITMISLCLRIGDKTLLNDALLWIDRAQHDRLIDDETTSTLKVNCFIALKQFAYASAQLQQSQLSMKPLLYAFQQQDQGNIHSAYYEYLQLITNNTLPETSLPIFFKHYYALSLDTQAIMYSSLNQWFDSQNERENNTRTFYRIQFRFYLVSRQLDRAQNTLAQYHRIYGEDEYYVLSCTTLLMRLNQHHDAIALLNRQHFVERNHRLYLQLATCYAEQGLLHDAKEIFEDLLLRFPKQDRIYTRAAHYLKSTFPQWVAKYDSHLCEEINVDEDLEFDNTDLLSYFTTSNQPGEWKNVEYHATFFELSLHRQATRKTGMQWANYTPTEYAQISETLRALDLALPISCREENLRMSRFDSYTLFYKKPLPASPQEASQPSFWTERTSQR